MNYIELKKINDNAPRAAEVQYYTSGRSRIIGGQLYTDNYGNKSVRKQTSRLWVDRKTADDFAKRFNAIIHKIDDMALSGIFSV